MPRIPPLDPANATGRSKELLDIIQRKLGFVPNLARTMVHQPAVLDAYIKFTDALSHGSFDAPTREAIALATAGANACDYCAAAHVTLAKSLGIDTIEINAHLAGRSTDSRLDAALIFARAVVAKRGEASDADIAAVRAAGHDDGAIIEIVANVAAGILTNYINHVARTMVDFPYVNPAKYRVA